MTSQVFAGTVTRQETYLAGGWQFLRRARDRDGYSEAPRKTMNNKYALNSITVTGDGNAVGNGNTVTVVKEHHVHHHNNRNTGNGGKDNGDGDAGAALGGLLVIAIAMAALSYWFARYASLAYTVAYVVASLEGVIAFFAIAVSLHAEDYATAGRNTVILLLAAVLAYAVATAAGDYNPQLTELANQAGGFKDFWCHLNLYGQQLASRHALLASFFIAPSLLLLAPHAMRSALIDIAGHYTSTRLLAPLAKLSPNSTLVVAGFLCLVVAWGHSAMGGEFWAHQFATRVTLLCPAS